jgi:hypothetical protein
MIIRDNSHTFETQKKDRCNFFSGPNCFPKKEPSELKKIETFYVIDNDGCEIKNYNAKVGSALLSLRKEDFESWKVFFNIEEDKPTRTQKILDPKECIIKQYEYWGE